MSHSTPLWKASVIGALCFGLLGCKGGGGGGAADQAASGAPKASAAPNTSGFVPAIPVAADKVAQVINPKGEQPYKGPAGTLKGVIRVKGDAPPAMDFTFPGGCGEAAATYGKLFRTGQDNTLADVMVAVTGYEGFVPAREPAKKMTIHGCALAKRTMTVAYGQRIEVSNIDKIESYMPYLDGAPFRAVLVAIPGGDPVKFYPQEPGHYLIRDQLPKPFLTADVYVVAYATHDVTGLDGQYEIADIPVGKVKVNAFLPAADLVTAQEIEIKAGENTLDMTLEFNRADYDKKVKAARTPPTPPPASTLGPKG